MVTRSLEWQMALLCLRFPGLFLAPQNCNACGRAGVSDKQKGQKPREGRARRDLGQGRGQLIGRLGACPLEGLRSVAPSGTGR